MCGILGAAGPSAPTKIEIENSLASLHHRGPDERGTFLESGIALGICRLAIIDVKTGQQPVSNEDGTIQMVFNGQIYNYQELRATLIAKGHKFRSQGDAEVIVHLYQEFGLDFVKHLRGMFALAIWDSRDNSLLLVRDHIGKKPLWYSINGNTLHFASEVKALIASGVKATLRSAAISEVMQFGYLNAPRSAFNEIAQIPPASMAIWKDGNLDVHRYWSPNFSNPTDISFSDAMDETKRLIKNSVERRLISERPLGSFLSGGYDSTVVTAYMSQLSPEKVKTFSIGFDDPRYDESAYARAIASHLGTEHTEEKLSPDPVLLLQKLATTLDQPFADSSIIPTFMLAQFASAEVVVALGGDGGDEVFGGYDRYLAVPVMQKWNALLALTAPLAGNQAIANRIQSRKLKRVLSQVHSYKSLGDRYKSVMSLNQFGEMTSLLSPDFLSTLAAEEFSKDFTRTGVRSDLDRMVRTDMESYLPGDLLVKADLATMANSLELRSPLLDVDLLEWAIRLPSSYKVKGRETKYILKEIARSLVPANLVDRPKMGFAIPRADWLRTGLRTMSYDLLTDSTAKGRGWFSPAKVERVLAEHMSGQDRDSTLWPMLMLELWARTWLDSGHRPG